MGAIKWPIRQHDSPFMNLIYDDDDQQICACNGRYAADLVPAANRGHEADNATGALQAIAFTVGIAPNDIEGATCDRLHEWIDARLDELIPAAAKSEGDPRLSEVVAAIKRLPPTDYAYITINQNDPIQIRRDGAATVVAPEMLLKYIASITDAARIAAIRGKLAGEELAFFEGLLRKDGAK